MEKAIHIVCLGGGTAMPSAVLEGLKKYPVKISAISAMLDSGGSAGKERKLFRTQVSFGDIRRAALALSQVSQEKKDLFSYRFANGTALANAYCTGSASAAGIEALLEDIKEDLKISKEHSVLPATLDDADLCAELENGDEVSGETNIDIPKHDVNLKIKKAFLKPEAKAYDPALKAIKEADLVVMGPGDLYSSLSQVLLVQGVSEAIRKSRAAVIYVCNLMTKKGETNDFSVSDLASEVEKYLGKELNFVIFNKNKPLSARTVSYKKDHPELLETVDFTDDLDKNKFIGEDLLIKEGPIVHDPDKVAKIILKLCPKQ